MSCYGRVLAVERGFDVAVNGCGNKAIGVSSKKCQVALEKSKNIFSGRFWVILRQILLVLRLFFAFFVNVSFFEGVKWGRYGLFL